MTGKGYRKSVIGYAPELIKRDGDIWRCHYCGINLVPLEIEVGTEPYYRLEMTQIQHPKTMGDGNGRWSWEEVMEATEAAAKGQLLYWTLYWTLAPGYAWPAVDHKIPRCKGGTDDLENLVVCCEKCNQRKRARDYDEFISQFRVQDGAS
jgi:hypothetical protein